MKSEEDLKSLPEIKERIKRLSQRLPIEIRSAANDQKTRVMFVIESLSAGLLCRTMELATNSADSIERKDYSSAAILARAIMENSALIWRLRTILAKSSNDEMADRLTKIMFGNRRDFVEGTEAISILTCIDDFEKHLPSFRETYDMFSEFAHPNWRGVTERYLRIDFESGISHIGPNIGNAKATSAGIENGLMGALLATEIALNGLDKQIALYDGQPSNSRTVHRH